MIFASLGTVTEVDIVAEEEIGQVAQTCVQASRPAPKRSHRVGGVCSAVDLPGQSAAQPNIR